MKKIVLFIAVSLLITCSVIAQSVITIVDSINSHPLPFATILIPTQGKSYFADGNGVITITFRDKIDTLIASSVGYTPRMITSSTDTIHLIANYSILPTVNIESKKLIGNILLSDEKNKIRDGWEDRVTTFSSPEFAQKFTLPIGTSTFKLKTVYIPIYKINCWGDIILNIYLSNIEDSIPGTERFSKRIRIKRKSIKNGKAAIDVSEEKINFNAGDQFFIGVTWDENYLQSKCKSLVYLQKTTTPNFVYRCKTCLLQLKSGTAIHPSNFDVWFPGGEFHHPGDSAHTWFGQMFGEVELEEYK